MAKSDMANRFGYRQILLRDPKCRSSRAAQPIGEGTDGGREAETPKASRSKAPKSSRSEEPKAPSRDAKGFERGNGVEIFHLKGSGGAS